MGYWRRLGDPQHSPGYENARIPMQLPYTDMQYEYHDEVSSENGTELRRLMARTMPTRTSTTWQAFRRIHRMSLLPSERRSLLYPDQSVLGIVPLPVGVVLASGTVGVGLP